MPTQAKIVLVSLAILTLVFSFEYLIFKNEDLTDRNKALTAQIEQLKNDAKTLSLQYDNARKQAEIDLQQAKQQTDTIMLAEVPKKCKEAVKWSVKQAKSFVV